ncbi:MAG: ArsR family transcriptional regulator, partial [Candidatus Micrarchaeota archaeon]
VEVFKEIVKANYRHRPLSSTKLCEGKGVTRGAIVYHLNKLMQSGLVIRRGRAYYLRAANLSRTLEEVEEDALRTLRRARRISEDIDRAFNMI